MTQSATGFLRALSAVSLSLVRSIAVICSMLNTFSSSMYITYNIQHTSAKAQEQLTMLLTFTAQQNAEVLASQEEFAARTRSLNNAGTMWCVCTCQLNPGFLVDLVSGLATHLYPRRARWHLWQVINQTGPQVLDKRIGERPTVETLESLDSVFAIGDHLCLSWEKKHQQILHEHKYEEGSRRKKNTEEWS